MDPTLKVNYPDLREFIECLLKESDQYISGETIGDILDSLDSYVEMYICQKLSR